MRCGSFPFSPPTRLSIGTVGTIAPILTARSRCPLHRLPAARTPFNEIFRSNAPDHPDLQRTHRTIPIPAKVPKTGTLPPFAIAKHRHPFHFRLT